MIAYIPARLGSVRFPRKVLTTINNESLINIVVRNAARCDYVSEVIILTDNQEIADEVAKVDYTKVSCVTNTSGKCGTDRVFNYRERYSESSPFVVIQADCPDLTSLHLNHFLASIICDPAEMIHTLVCPMGSLQAQCAQNVKAVFDHTKRVLYFSRLPIPFTGPYHKHIGVYVFTKPVIDRYMHLITKSVDHMAKAEDLEQLNWMMQGVDMKVTVLDSYLRSIDTPADYMQFSSATKL